MIQSHNNMKINHYEFRLNDWISKPCEYKNWDEKWTEQIEGSLSMFSREYRDVDIVVSERRVFTHFIEKSNDVFHSTKIKIPSFHFGSEIFSWLTSRDESDESIPSAFAIDKVTPSETQAK